MTRSEIISQFRQENPEVTARVITDTVLNSWLKEGNKNFCARTRCLVDQEGTEIAGLVEGDDNFDLTDKITSFFDVDEWPGGGLVYNNKRLERVTIGDLDRRKSQWRTQGNGIPRKWFRRGPFVYLERGLPASPDTLLVYAVLKPTDWITDIAPYNAETHLEPFHYGMVEWLVWKAKKKVGKGSAEQKALASYLDYIKWVKNELGGGKYARIDLVPSEYARRNYRTRRGNL